VPGGAEDQLKISNFDLEALKQVLYSVGELVRTFRSVCTRSTISPEVRYFLIYRQIELRVGHQNLPPYATQIQLLFLAGRRPKLAAKTYPVD
jgi:hypothetical protein